MDQPNQELGALVFDAYGTLFDVDSVTGACEEVFPGRGEVLSQLWRAKQLQYTWLCSLMGRYEDFWRLTERSLTFACLALELDPADAARGRLAEGYLRLQPFPEVPEALRSLAGRPLAILSNGTPGMLQPLLEHADLGGAFTAVLSADTVRTYKPSPSVYELAPVHLAVDSSRIGFVSSNSFDVIGAATFGFRSIWVNRSAAPLDQLGQPPHLTVSDLAELADALPTV